MKAAVCAPGMKTPLGPSHLLDGGPILAFGAMCHDLMDRTMSSTITPNSSSYSGQQTPPAGDSSAPPHPPHPHIYYNTSNKQC